MTFYRLSNRILETDSGGVRGQTRLVCLFYGIARPPGRGRGRLPIAASTELFVWRDGRTGYRETWLRNRRLVGWPSACTLSPRCHARLSRSLLSVYQSVCLSVCLPAYPPFYSATR